VKWFDIRLLRSVVVIFQAYLTTAMASVSTSKAIKRNVFIVLCEITEMDGVPVLALNNS